MANQPLEVHIKKGVGTAEATRTPTNKEGTPALRGETSATKKATQSHLIRVAQDAIMLGVNKTGDLTGNYMFARQINNAIAISGVVATLAYAGPVVGGIMVGGQAIMQVGSTMIDNYTEVRNIEFNNQRLGRISRAGSR